MCVWGLYQIMEEERREDREERRGEEEGRFINTEQLNRT